MQAQPTRRINEIIVGDDRFRKDMGDIPALAARIVELGLLHPIVIRPDGMLAGGVGIDQCHRCHRFKSEWHSFSQPLVVVANGAIGQR